jgi:filamentous hemagglutinin
MNANSPNLSISNNAMLQLLPATPYTSTIAEGRTLQVGVTSTQGSLVGNSNATISNSGTIRSGDSTSSTGGQIFNMRINNTSTGVITSAANNFLLQNSHITGGTITITNTNPSPNVGRITYQGGSLNDVTLKRSGTGFHEVTQSMLLNGITVDNTVLQLRDNTTMSGVNSVVNGGTLNNNTGKTLTMLAGASLSGDVTNRTMMNGQGTLSGVTQLGGGTISATTGNFSYEGGSISNQTLSATGAHVHQVTSGTLNLQGATTLASGTQMNVAGGGSLSFGAGTNSINGALRNSSTTTGVSILNNSTVAGSGALINDAGSVIGGNGTLNVANITNAGTIQGNATSFGLAINSSGGVDNSGGTLRSGTSSGAVLTLNTMVTGGTITVGGPANVVYAGGKITGSVLNEASGAVGIHRVTGNTTFDNVTLAASTAFTVDSGKIATIENVFNSFGDITNNGTMFGHLVLHSGATYGGAGIFDGQLDRVGSSNVSSANSFVDVLGGTSRAGGLSVKFPDLTESGLIGATSSIISVKDLPTSGGALSSINFAIPGLSLQAWDITFGGTFTGLATLTFAYDQNLLGGINENYLQIYHWNGSLWEMQNRLQLNTDSNTITVEASSFSPFALGFGGLAVVPEPASITIFALGFLGVLCYRRSKR